MENKQKRQYLTAVSIECGIITLLNENGNIQSYRQRGIDQISEEQLNLLTAMGLLRRDWELYEELPVYVSISYEDPCIYGVAREAYPSEVIEAIQPTAKLKKKYLKR